MKHRAIRRGLFYFLTAAACILFYFALDRFDGIALIIRTVVRIVRPFIIGAVIAYLLTPVSAKISACLKKQFLKTPDRKEALTDRDLRRFERKAARIETISILLSLLSGILLVYGLLMLILPQVLASILGIVRNMPVYLENLRIYVERLVERIPELSSYLGEITAYVEKEGSRLLSEYLLPHMNRVIANVSGNALAAFSAMKDLLIGLMIAIYFMNIRKTFRRQAKMLIMALFPYKWDLPDGHEQFADWVFREMIILNEYTGNFIKGKLIDSFIIGLAATIFNFAAKMPYPLLIGVVIGVTNIIPFFGPFIGAIPAALLILMADSGKCLPFVIFIIILQQIDGNIIGPKVLGDATHLNSFWVLFAILFFGGLFGIPGMILGVPVFGFIYQLVRELVYKRLDRQKRLLVDYYNEEEE